jgi:hypothetical protein
MTKGAGDHTKGKYYKEVDPTKKTGARKKTGATTRAVIFK